MLKIIWFNCYIVFVTGEEMKTLSPEGELVLKQFNQRMVRETKKLLFIVKYKTIYNLKASYNNILKDTWEGRLKSVENNVQEQLNELKIQMSNVIESSSLPGVVDDDQDGRMLHYHQIQKRENQQPAVSVTTHKPLCVNSSRPCSYYTIAIVPIWKSLQWLGKTTALIYTLITLTRKLCL